LTVDVPTELTAGDSAAWTVSWENFGRGPYTVAMTMGGGMTADLPDASAAASPFISSFTPVAGDYAQSQSYAYTVTVTAGSTGMLSTSGSYEVYTPPPSAPAIDEVLIQVSILTVSVSSPAAVPLTVTVSEPPGLMADSTSKVVEGGAGDVVFYWSATDIIAGGAGETTIIVADDYGGTDTATAMIDTYVHPATDGELIAVPAATEARVNEPVTVMVISSAFSHPFYSMDWIELSLDRGAQYVDGSFNAGIPGGERLAPDGVWSGMNPQPEALLGGFLHGIEPDYILDRVNFSFSLIPIGGCDTSNGGALFCFELRFTRSGTYTIKLLEGQEFSRTRFSDQAGNEYYWNDISNNHRGVPNTIVVTE